MERAKQAISEFTSRDGQHKTEVDRDTRAEVTEEHVRPTRHEETTTVLDKEIHQDHHQTLIQPIKHQETLPEQHHHNAAPVIHKTFEHDKADNAPHLEDAARYKDTSTTHDTTHTSSVAQAVTGEHVHHHVHQHIQPVVQKEVHQPHVVHTTIPIHETHHAPTISHGSTVLPAKTLDEFERTKGELGRTGHTGEFDGCAKDVVGESVGHKHGHHGEHQHGHHSEHQHGLGGKDSGIGMRDEAGMRGGAMGAGNREGLTGGLGDSTGKRHGVAGDGNYKTESQRFVDPQGGKLNTATVGRSGNTGAGLGAGAGAGLATAGAGATSRTGADPTVPRTEQGQGLSNTQTGQSETSTTASGRKVSLVDKLNPFKDADGDGKKGIMS